MARDPRKPVPISTRDLKWSAIESARTDVDDLFRKAGSYKRLASRMTDLGFRVSHVTLRKWHEGTTAPPLQRWDWIRKHKQELFARSMNDPRQQAQELVWKIIDKAEVETRGPRKRGPHDEQLRTALLGLPEDKAIRMPCPEGIGMSAFCNRIRTRLSKWSERGVIPFRVTVIKQRSDKTIAIYRSNYDQADDEDP